MPDLSYCQVMIGRAMTGLIGLQEILEALAGDGLPAETPQIGQRLIQELGKHNYVPARAAPDYEAALVREYNRYLQDRAAGKGARLWRDPRKEHAPWFPTLFEAKCDGCGECLSVCPNSVLGWNPEHTKVLVLEPYECAPGCQLCAKACPRKALIMPPRESLHQPISQHSEPACDTCSQTECPTCGQRRSP
jgi:NAD-dependent dihydropyrimidine dehydrogenase PreA subunit